MRTVVIYDSKFGNTEKIAQAVARGAGTAGSVRVINAAEAVPAFAERPDLMFIGGPTQRRGLTPALRSLIEALPQGLRGVPSAAFDTRYRGTTLFMGSAAADAGRRLGKAGGRAVVPPESFFVARGGPMELQRLEAGELERAEEWGRAVGAAAANRVAGAVS
jgi:flavodoxin